jgi:hypothetical protein
MNMISFLKVFYLPPVHKCILKEALSLASEE